jgi:hypothetical protein
MIKNNIETSHINGLSSTSIIGGNKITSATSSTNISKINSHDIDNLLSMLTSEDNNSTVKKPLKNIVKHRGGVSSEYETDNTETLQLKLNKLLQINGGDNNTTENTMTLEHNLSNLLKQDGGAGVDVNDTENTIMLEDKLQHLLKNNKKSKIIQNGGIKAILGLAGLGLAATLAHKYSSETETEFNSNKILSKKPIVNESVEPNEKKEVIKEPVKYMLVPLENDKNSNSNSIFLPSSETSSINKTGGELLVNTTTNVSEPDASEPYFSDTSAENSESATSVDNVNDQQGGARELSLGMKAFQEICKLISAKLGITNGPGAKKIGGQLQRDVKEITPDITADKIVDAATKLLEKNKSKYQTMANPYKKASDTMKGKKTKNTKTTN